MRSHGSVGFCLLNETGSNSYHLKVRIGEERSSGLQRVGGVKSLSGKVETQWTEEM